MAEWGDDSCRLEAENVRQSFRQKFWNAERQCLYDVLAEDGPVRTLRPNQIFAVSLRNGLLDQDRQRAVVSIVERELLTPVGLRTLERSDPAYRPRYEGGPRERDGAYHQGTVWPCLMGQFVDACISAAFGETNANRSLIAGNWWNAWKRKLPAPVVSARSPRSTMETSLASREAVRPKPGASRGNLAK